MYVHTLRHGKHVCSLETTFLNWEICDNIMKLYIRDVSVGTVLQLVQLLWQHGYKWSSSCGCCDGSLCSYQWIWLYYYSRRSWANHCLYQLLLGSYHTFKDQVSEIHKTWYLHCCNFIPGHCYIMRLVPSCSPWKQAFTWHVVRLHSQNILIDWLID